MRIKDIEESSSDVRFGDECRVLVINNISALITVITMDFLSFS